MLTDLMFVSLYISSPCCFISLVLNQEYYDHFGVALLSLISRVWFLLKCLFLWLRIIYLCCYLLVNLVLFWHLENYCIGMYVDLHFLCYA